MIKELEETIRETSNFNPHIYYSKKRKTWNCMMSAGFSTIEKKDFHDLIRTVLAQVLLKRDQIKSKFTYKE